MTVVRNVVQFLNKGQIPVATFDQPNYHGWRSGLSVFSLDVSSLAPCLHVGRIPECLFMVQKQANRVLKTISIRTVDTEVLDLAISVVEQLGVDELRLDFGVGKHRRYLPSHLLAHAIRSI